MNYKTRNDIILSPDYFTTIPRKEDNLFGIPVAYNEGLEYGEVVII